MVRATLHAFVLVCVSFAPLSAQGPPCFAENDGPGFNDLVSMGGPNLLLAIRLVPPQDLVVTRIEVFTGEVTGPNTIGIWSHDAGEDQPLADLGTGGWDMDENNSWQGADLPAPLTLLEAEVYWVVWGPQNFSQASVLEPQMDLGQVYRPSFDGGASWLGPFQFTSDHWKYRFFCQGLDPMFLRGDVDGSGVVNGLVDGLFILNFQFVPGSPVPPCDDAADVDDDGMVSGLVDGLFLLTFQFIVGSPPPPDPGPMVCGIDPTADGLDCVVSACP